VRSNAPRMGVWRLGQADIVVNNAFYMARGRVEEVDVEQWRKSFAVNLEAQFHSARHFAPRMRAHHWGRFIAISSNSIGIAEIGLSAYMATKMGASGAHHVRSGAARVEEPGGARCRLGGAGFGLAPSTSCGMRSASSPAAAGEGASATSSAAIAPAKTHHSSAKRGRNSRWNHASFTSSAR
jgi:NAD(P)-dependent dehydrogenase (short-subunit alcohol dehydrogenase family)